MFNSLSNNPVTKRLSSYTPGVIVIDSVELAGSGNDSTVFMKSLNQSDIPSCIREYTDSIRLYPLNSFFPYPLFASFRI